MHALGATLWCAMQSTAVRLCVTAADALQVLTVMPIHILYRSTATILEYSTRTNATMFAGCRPLAAADVEVMRPSMSFAP